MMFWVITCTLLGFLGGLTLGFTLAADRFYKLGQRVDPKANIPAPKAPRSEFEPPILSPMPFHDFKKCSNSPYCEECGGGALHAVHARTALQTVNQELWAKIQTQIQRKGQQ